MIDYSYTLEGAYNKTSREPVKGQIPTHEEVSSRPLHSWSATDSITGGFQSSSESFTSINESFISLGGKNNKSHPGSPLSVNRSTYGEPFIDLDKVTEYSVIFQRRLSENSSIMHKSTTKLVESDSLVSLPHNHINHSFIKPSEVMTSNDNSSDVTYGIKEITNSIDPYTTLKVGVIAPNNSLITSVSNATVSKAESDLSENTLQDKNKKKVNQTNSTFT
ncbi:hypothetical protein DFJ63DRAFT_114876 [Scheffersomyces coipomensis]|uniref:uncharacterized protein n=1 Tax=Scheffersomyces coipomensis TaxID=1788519 RepID=UPI00315DA825